MKQINREQLNQDLQNELNQRRRSALSSNVPAVVNTPPVVSDACYAAYTESPSLVEVYVNGLLETGFTIDTTAKTLTLTGYTDTGWTADDTVEVFYYGAT
jgi:hypothetical protein